MYHCTQKIMLSLKFEKYILYTLLLSLVYAIIINIYPIPINFDISRFIKFYHIFQESSVSEYFKIFTKSPDFLAQLILLILAKLNLSIHIFFFTTAFLSSFNFLHTFQYYYRKHHSKPPVFWMYLIVWMSISVPGILSGIRNIHALSFVALAFVFLDQKRNIPFWTCLLYAAFFHYSVYIIIIAYLIFQSKYFTIQQYKIFAILGAFVFLFIFFIPSHLLQTLLPESIFKKIEYYILHNSLLKEHLNSYNWKGLIYFILHKTLIPYLYIILYFYYFKIKILSTETLCLMFSCILFIFFPNTLSRYWSLLYIYSIIKILIIYQPISKYRYFIGFHILYFISQCLLLSKSIYHAVQTKAIVI
ncbi:EpsG family protein [Elizabethkingia sp. JS20170427COW]|uniref:EpsG family protein n=1 Tax=Elizabethkingia sp. JS20170427COW TaxID=2583851 RepID=UPI0011107ADC|nr:EpsG family protein [Elizabethkingia sp. JS20170427COW]QCX53664.1 hypothetical protein FGE20_07950 [Elizabethkingia sp. JS20170427COW]